MSICLEAKEISQVAFLPLQKMLMRKGEHKKKEDFYKNTI